MTTKDKSATSGSSENEVVIEASQDVPVISAEQLEAVAKSMQEANDAVAQSLENVRTTVEKMAIQPQDK